MPKKTRLRKLRNQRKILEGSQIAQSATISLDFQSGDSAFKKDILKSITFAILITMVEIALYFIYYLRVFERR